MDSSGRGCWQALRRNTPTKFQSFCVNGFLWKIDILSDRTRNIAFQSFCVNGFLWKILVWIADEIWIAVSILLCQWIPLEESANCGTYPDGNLFQSFCVNGFLWKCKICPRLNFIHIVSILLCQWIPLEAVGTANALNQRRLDSFIFFSFFVFTVCQRAFLHRF